MDFNTRIIEEFRANGGRVGGPFEGGRLLLLTTTGARTGAPHTTPLAYLPDGLSRVLVIASAGGAPKNPAWFHNLVADPRVTVESGSFTYEADAVVLAGTNATAPSRVPWRPIPDGPLRERVGADAARRRPGPDRLRRPAGRRRPARCSWRCTTRSARSSR